MAVTSSSFKVKFPEFANADDVLVQTFIDDAYVLCPVDPWGTYQDMGVELTVAQALALSPNARDMQLDSKEGTTIYDARLERLRRVVALGCRVVT